MNCNYDEVKSVLYSKRNPITCTITDDALMISLLDVTTTAQAESEVKKLCSSAYDTTPLTFKFEDISMKGTQFDNEYYSGGTYWNYEVQTNAGENALKEDASRVGRVYEYEAQRRAIDLPNYLESFNPDQDGDGECNHNAAFCCWVQDRQANDNNGELFIHKLLNVESICDLSQKCLCNFNMPQFKICVISITTCAPL